MKFVFPDCCARLNVRSISGCQVQMDSEKNILKVKIFGTDYPLKVTANVDYVRRVAEYVDMKMKEIQEAKPNKPLHQIAILAALNITDELLQQKELQRRKLRNFEDRVGKLAQKLELGIKEVSEVNEEQHIVDLDITR
jgi:cell division protein ZapA